jgi:hypothetical protein
MGDYCTPDYGFGSCAGLCGNMTPFGCSCEYGCELIGDCCQDFFMYCAV